MEQLDKHGLDKAYQDVNHIYYDRKYNTLFISGTNSTNDLITDLSIPLNQLENTQRYRQALQLVNLYDPRTIVGHSLGASITNTLLNHFNKNYIKYQGRGYASPIVLNAPGMKTYRKIGDPISILNRQANILPSTGINPHSYN